MTTKSERTRHPDGDHENRPRISFGNFGREQQDQPVLWIHRDAKTRVYAGFFEQFSESLDSEGLECGAEGI